MDTRVVVVGAGPIGLETAYELKRRGIPYVHVDKGPVAATLTWFPQEMTFFSSPDRLAIAGVPLATPGQRKCTKEEYLAYLRTVAATHGLAVRTFTEVVAIERGSGGRFTVRTRDAAGEGAISCEALVLATGDMARPRLLNIPGEDLPHVSHFFEAPHPFFRRRLLVVGGRNSAVEAALRSWHAGAEVTLSYRGAAFDDRAVKYWLLPELEGRIRRGEIRCLLRTAPVGITPTRATLRHADGRTEDVAADHVLLLTGYVADMTLFERAGVTLRGDRRTPVFDPRTMETDVEGVYVAGTASAGTQVGYSLFIENCHIHARRIAAALSGEPPPPDPPPLARPES